MRFLPVASGLVLPSCVSIAVAPAPRDGDVEVLLIDEACHKGLVLPGADGRRVEWGFGDFAWYALEENRWYDAFGTVLWPNPGTLSRRVWEPGELERREELDVVAFRAERARVERLSAGLEASFERARGSYHWNEHYRTGFVSSPDAYWMFHDCHDATARWLEALGCRVEPALVRTGLLLRAARTAED